MRLRRMPTGMWLDPHDVVMVTYHELNKQVGIRYRGISDVRWYNAHGSTADEWVAAMQTHSVPR